jgi:hypothetical protein
MIFWGRPPVLHKHLLWMHHFCCQKLLKNPFTTNNILQHTSNMGTVHYVRFRSLSWKKPLLQKGNQRKYYPENNHFGCSLCCALLQREKDLSQRYLNRLVNTFVCI